MPPAIHGQAQLGSFLAGFIIGITVVNHCHSGPVGMIEKNNFVVIRSSHVISCMLKYLSHLSSQFSSAHSWLHPSFGQTSHVMSAQKSVDSASVLSVLAASVVFVEFTGEAFVLVVVTRRGTKQQYSASII